MIFLVSLIISLLSLFYVHFSVFHIFRFPLFHCFVPQPFLSSALSFSLCLSVSICVSLSVSLSLSDHISFPCRSLALSSLSFVCIYGCMHVRMCVWMYVCLFAYVCMHALVYIFMYIYMYLMYYARVYVGLCIFVCVYACIALFLSFHSNGLAHCHYSAVPFLRFSRCAMYEDNLLKSSRRRHRWFLSSGAGPEFHLLLILLFIFLVPLRLATFHISSSFLPSLSLFLPLFLFLTLSPVCLYVSLPLLPLSLSYVRYLALLVVLSACLPDCLSLSLYIFRSCSISRSHSNCLCRSFSLSLHLSLPSLLRTVPGGFHPLSF